MNILMSNFSPLFCGPIQLKTMKAWGEGCKGKPTSEYNYDDILSVSLHYFHRYHSFVFVFVFLLYSFLYSQGKAHIWIQWIRWYLESQLTVLICSMTLFCFIILKFVCIFVLAYIVIFVFVRESTHLNSITMISWVSSFTSSPALWHFSVKWRRKN